MTDPGISAEYEFNASWRFRVASRLPGIRRFTAAIIHLSRELSTVSQELSSAISRCESLQAERDALKARIEFLLQQVEALSVLAAAEERERDLALDQISELRKHQP